MENRYRKGWRIGTERVGEQVQKGLENRFRKGWRIGTERVNELKISRLRVVKRRVHKALIGGGGGGGVIVVTFTPPKNKYFRYDKILGNLFTVFW